MPLSPTAALSSGRAIPRVGLGVDEAEPDRPRSVLADPVVGEVAASSGVSPAQVVLDG